MSKPVVHLGALAVVLLATSGWAQTPASPKAVIDKYCVTCHNERLKRGDLVLSPLDPAHVASDVAEMLTVSPGLLERYLLAGKKIARLAVGDSTVRPTATIYDIPYMTLVQDEGMSEGLPFGSRGGVAIKHYCPIDGEYEIEVRV